MTVFRTPEKHLTVKCDDCGHELATDALNVHELWARAKEAGWRWVRRTYTELSAYEWRPRLRKIVCARCAEQVIAEKKLAA